MAVIPYISPRRRAELKANLARVREQYPMSRPVSLDDIAAALACNGPDNYFMTSAHYWDCNCTDDYFRPYAVAYCPDCDSDRDDCADSRLHELAHAGITLDWSDPADRLKCDEYNLAAKPRAMAALAAATS